jgi:hypothetical protein
MKQFPRIYSLSTLGLRQHQQFDYLFHPFRTDFVGESGSGKSMIADLLQLTIVGSEAFQSATESMQKRTPDGMVLKTKHSRGTEIGYTFLNIRLNPAEFIVIGAYLESSSTHTISFIVQQGYDPEKLYPLNQNLTTRDFITDGKIPPIDELKTNLEARGLVCQSFSHKRKYYKFLFNHKILSIDLTTSDKTLKDFAAIIQSFSRGNTLEIHRSSSLTGFLFGEEKGKEIFRKYQQAVDELQSAILDYGRNREEIQKVTIKQKSLLELLNDKGEMKLSEKTYLSKNCLYYDQQFRFLKDNLKDQVRNFISGKNNLQTLKAIITKEIENSGNELRNLENVVEETKSKYESILLKYRKVQQLEHFQDKYNCTIDELQIKYTANKKLSFHKQILTEILLKLKENYTFELFQSIPLIDTSAHILKALNGEISQLENQIETKTAFLDFIDLGKQGSFGNWALRQKKPFTLSIESIIHHYSSVPLKKITHPKPRDKYIPNPEIFIKDAGVTDSTNEGFWLYLRGIKEYIPFVDKQILTKENLQDVETFLNDYSKNIEKEILEFKNKKSQFQKLIDFISNENSFNEFLKAYSRKSELDTRTVDTELNISAEEFNGLVEVHSEKENIKKRYLKYKNRNTEAIEKRTNYSNYLNRMAGFNNQLETILENGRWTAEILTIINSIRKELVIPEENNQLEKYLSYQINKAEDKEHYILQLIDENRAMLNTLKIIDTSKKVDGAKQDREKAWQVYELTYNDAPIINPESEIVDNMSLEREDYNLKVRLYQEKFQQVVEAYIPNDKYKFETTYVFSELTRSILPEAFQSQIIEENTVVEAIEKYLQNINEKNRELNKRKLQRIRNLLDEVNDEVTHRLDIARRIDNFLNNEQREITGGYRVRLKRDFSNEYPKNWLENFQIKLEEENTLFTTSDTRLSDTLSESISLQEKIMTAFYQCGGHSSTKPKIEKLLDPNSYIELTFSMESHEGQVNKGSTGQTYAAIALLCIARLSIIDSADPNIVSPGIRFMPIDEAEGLGSNYDMLYHIAKQFDYQIISMSINPLGKFKEGEQFLYILHENTEVEENVNYTPFAIFSESDKASQNVFDF